MTTAEKINIGLLIVNFLMFLAMFITLLIQNKANKQNQKSIINSNSQLTNSILSLKIQMLTSIVENKQNQLKVLDRSKGIEDQKKIDSLAEEIKELTDVLTNHLKEI
ncbi:hypothetical protein [Psychroserpens luteolus]|uniref:hypothetical protein n=1 Tax=Psychroserpens luteolus TaxID=2855840 RepID=UPI001E4D38FE|nr:hypothetical protein [Psychroserpens luteolus]MCD2259775.1 hypothetical protein [Psychroserpens luteolus]